MVSAASTPSPLPDFDVSLFLEEVLGSPAGQGEIRAVHVEPPRGARRVPVPASLHPRWLAYFESKGIDGLYSHQAEAIEAALARRNVVLATGTASGKTLAYNVPVLESFLRGERGYALYLFPTKALAQDQMRVLDEMLRALDLEVEAGVFDGDTEPTVRRRLRRRGRIILTNPDMLHHAILPHHGGWAGLFSGLDTVVVDEVHALRGIFGSNVALVFRRLRRIAAHYGSEPRFLCASATIRNPKEHTERLLGVPVEVVSEDGAPSGRKTFVLWNPPLFRRPDGSQGRKSPAAVATRLLPELLKREVRSICFAPARSTVELILRYTGERLQRHRSTAPLGERLEAYRAGYLPGERRAIEERLFRGELLGVVSTNALELGIDIGGLDAVLIAGYPGSVAAFLQRAGRAGRAARESLVVFIAGSQPIDQYFMRHPQAFFERPVETATIDPENPYILTKHLVCAAYELPLSGEDTALFGGQLEGILELLAEKGRLRRAEGKWFYASDDYPAKHVKLRTVGEENFTIYELTTGRVVGELDYVAGLLSLYEGAVYMHRSETHVVEELDVENQIARIRRGDTGYYTQALCRKRVIVEEEYESRGRTLSRLALGDVTVETRVTGFKKVRFHTSENIGYGEVELPPLILETVSVYIDLDEKAVRHVMQYGADFFHSGLQGVGRLVSQLIPLFVMAEPQDLDYFLDGKRLYFYDLYPGGIGYAEAAYERFEEILEATYEHLVSCECEAGCPGCVLPASTRYEIASEPTVREFPFPKEAARLLLTLLLGKEPYVPRLEAVTMEGTGDALAGRPALDARTRRKVLRAMKDL